MTAEKRQMHLTAFNMSPGGHWRWPDAEPEIDMSFQHYVKLAQTAERGKLDMVFFQDSAASAGSNAMAKGDRSGNFAACVRLEPMSLLPALAAVTRNIGLVATATTTYNEPFHVARKFLTIDHISGGRAGWNLVTSQLEDEAQNFGRDAHTDHAERYDRAMEFYDVVTGLWDSWEEDAVIRDKTTGRYFDPDKVHLLNHAGKHFKVRGPLNVARSPQGRPIVAQAGSSEPGKEMAAKGADVVFTAQTTLKDAQAFYADVKGRMAKYGRNPDHLKIMPGLNFVIGATESEAREKREALNATMPIEVAMRSITRLTGHVNLWDYDLDGPLPTNLPPSNAARARQQMLIDLGKQGLTIRQIAQRFAQAQGHNVVVGTPVQIADMMEDWFVNGGADGYTLLQPYYTKPLTEFVDLVVPELQRRGIFRTEYTSDTLRGHLGLPVPENRYARRRHAAE